MELKTKSKRPGMNCSIDVFYEKVKGFSAYLNDRNVYKAVLVKTGSFVVDENGEYRVVTAPAGILINEKADFKRTISLHPRFISSLLLSARNLLSRRSIPVNTISFTPP